MSYAIFWPMIAQVALTAAVASCMYRRRVREIRSRRIRPQSLATRRQAGAELDDIAAADNYQNLFEAPVLFYVVGLAFAISQTATSVELVLAWAYVALRCVHSVIHVTYNRVMHRFVAFVTSSLVLLCLWLLFAYRLTVQSG